LFTGSPAPPTAHLQLQQQVASTEVDDENGDGEDEGDCGAKDERSPDGLASPPISPSLDFSPSTAHSPSPDPSKHVIHPSLRDPGVLGLPHPLFTIMQLGVDRRLLVNRKRQLKMYRVWMQGKFQRTEADGLPLVVERDTGVP
jgi:tRNAThr (cytosine32-N3)-methyltransferase